MVTKLCVCCRQEVKYHPHKRCRGGLHIKISSAYAPGGTKCCDAPATFFLSHLQRCNLTPNSKWDSEKFLLECLWDFFPQGGWVCTWNCEVGSSEEEKSAGHPPHPLHPLLLPSCPTPLYFLHASLFYGHFGHLHPAPTTQMDTFRSTSVCLMLGSFWKKVGILGWTKCSFCLACERFLERGWMSEFVHCICIDQFLWPWDFPPRKLDRYCGSDGKEPRKIWTR